MKRSSWVMFSMVNVALAACSSGGSPEAASSVLQVTTATLPGGVADVAYDANVDATPGYSNYAWSAMGTLPPGLMLDPQATGATTRLLGTPTAAGTFAFTVTVSANGTTASQQFSTVIVAAGFPPGTKVTNVTINNTVVLSGVKRLGLNTGDEDRWAASKILVNQLPNPGFEPGVFGTVWQASTGSTNNLFVPRDWNTSTGNQPAGFWDGAEFEIVYGAGSGTSGAVQAFTHSGSDYHFDLGNHGGTALADRDILFTRRTLPGVQGMNGGVGTADTSNPYSGIQSLRLSPADNFDYVMDASWRDGDQSSHKLQVVEGSWRIRLKARAAHAGDQIQVRFYRDGGPPYNPTFLNRTFNLTGSWATYTEDQSIAPGTDQTPEPWPTGTYRPTLNFAVNVAAGNVGNVWIDEVELYRVDDATNPTVFSDRFVQRLLDYHPGVLRWWSDQLGETLDNMTRSWPQRGTCGHRPDGALAATWNYGMPDFLQLCAHIGAEPWIVMPPTASQADLLGLMEYLAGTSGTYATRRVNQGQTAPWTSVFDKIHLEWGNELWGDGSPNDPFGGASVNGGVRLGNLAQRAFTFMRASSWYTATAGKFDFVIGGQAGYSGRQQEIEANASGQHSTALAPYFGSLTNFANDAEVYGPLFARPFYEALNQNGGMHQSKQFLVNGGHGTNLSLYEINYHTTQVVPGLSGALRNQFVAGASGAIALPLTMLVYMTALGAREQCAFVALGYSFPFDLSGGWPPPQDHFVQIWGLLRDLYHYNVRRPTWLGVELANKAIMGDAITTTQTGDNPTWTQSAINGVGAPTTVPYVQSFAFRNGTQYGIVLMNLSLADQEGVRLHVPGTPQASATIYKIEPAHLADMNTTSEVVTLDTQSVGSFHNSYEMLLPPHSIRAVIWSN